MEAEVGAEPQMETHGLESQPVSDEGDSPTRGRKEVDGKLEVNHWAPYPFYFQSPKEGIEEKEELEYIWKERHVNPVNSSFKHDFLRVEL